MHQFWHDFRTFAGWAMEFLTITPLVFVTFILLAASVLTLWRTHRSIREHWIAPYSFVFFQYMAFPAMIAIAVLGQVRPIAWPRQQPHGWAIWSSELIFWGCVCYGAVCIWKLKHIRGLAVIVFLWCQWLMQGAGIITSCALSGIWP